MSKLIKFTLEAIFYAKNIDDAFDKLSKHFRDLADDNDGRTFYEPGTEFHLKPVVEEPLQ